MNLHLLLILLLNQVIVQRVYLRTELEGLLFFSRNHQKMFLNSKNMEGDKVDLYKKLKILMVRLLHLKNLLEVIKVLKKYNLEKVCLLLRKNNSHLSVLFPKMKERKFKEVERVV